MKLSKLTYTLLFASICFNISAHEQVEKKLSTLDKLRKEGRVISTSKSDKQQETPVDSKGYECVITGTKPVK